MGTKPCVKCGSQDQYKSGRCKPCNRAVSRARYEARRDEVKARSAAYYKTHSEQLYLRRVAWAKANPVKVLFRSSKNSASKHGHVPMSLEDCERAIATRPEMCESCQERPATDCDHDHKTGRFRGWLCSGCNQAEGLLGSLDRLRALEKYMVKNKS